MLSNPLGTNLHFGTLNSPSCSSISGSCAMIRADMAQAWPIRDPIPSKPRPRRARDHKCALHRKSSLAGLRWAGIVGLWLLIHARERIGRAVLANTAAQIPGPDLWNSRIHRPVKPVDGVAAAAAERWFTKGFRDTNPEKVERVLEMVRTTPLNGYLAACAAGRDMDQREAIRSIGNKVLSLPGGTICRHRQGWAPLVANSIEGANSSRWKHRIFRISRMRQISPRPPSLF